MNLAAMILLCAAAAVAAPMYFHRFQGAGNRYLYAASAVSLVLLAAAGLTASLGGGGLGHGVYAFAVAAAAIGGGPATVTILRLSFNASHPENAVDPEDAPVLRGGAWIGVLERTSIAATLLRVPSLMRKIRSIDATTLLIHGTADNVVRPGAARWLAARRPDWEYVELEGVGHVPQVEVPERFVEMVRAFAG